MAGDLRAGEVVSEENDIIDRLGCRWLVRVAFFVSAAAALRACV